MGIRDGNQLSSRNILRSPNRSPFDDIPLSSSQSIPFNSSKLEMFPVAEQTLRMNSSTEDFRDLQNGINGDTDVQEANTSSSGQQIPAPEHTQNRRRKSSTSRHLHLTRGSPVPHETAPVSPGADNVFGDTEGSPPSRNFGNEAGSSPRTPKGCCSAEVNRMRWKIRFFFMDPIQKWKTKHQFPWKLFLQVVKIIFVSIQLVTFGNERYNFAMFLTKNTVTFRHLLLQGWNDPDIPIPIYPNTGLYACYITDTFYDKADFAVNQFTSIRDIAIGTYQYASTVSCANQMIQTNATSFCVCKREFNQAHIFPENHSYIYDSAIKESCFAVSIDEFEDKTFRLRDYLAARNESIVFDKLVDARLLFAVKSVALNPNAPDDEPTCYIFNIAIHFDNSGHNGQIPVNLDVDPHVVPCNGKVLYEDHQSVMDILLVLLDVSVLIICTVSLLLCLRALYNAEMLKRTVTDFFTTQFGYTLTKTEVMEFLNLWYVMIVVNDFLIVIGSIVKLKISAATITELPLYNACGMLLGIGNLLVWFGVLRYLGFFKTYNILILTVKKAIPNVLRYLVCILLIFCGFSFCGWIVLGPYHVKFQTFHSTTETIFSLINGDDMFATFAILAYQNSLIWYFSRLYLYLFICVFTYVVLSLMISLIMDAYGTVKDFYEQGGPVSLLQDFMKEPSSTSTDPCTQFPPHDDDNVSSYDATADHLRQQCCGCCNWIKRRSPFKRRELVESDSWVPHQRLNG